jgi:hypothetical protein
LFQYGRENLPEGKSLLVAGIGKGKKFHCAWRTKKENTRQLFFSFMQKYKAL